jgi:hypothetical protein
VVPTDGGPVGTSIISWMATPHFFKPGHALVFQVALTTQSLTDHAVIVYKQNPGGHGGIICIREKYVDFVGQNAQGIISRLKWFRFNRIDKI